ncbi:uncharacterized protein LOC128884450 isoform X2 [Hylaeus volcanicus]|uniref:uncharacterized protein LOC128884450 isoform X2 n=1 Tax=Hylaeus volcanicus TaxID=313075 RepID=UPI0023B8435B|nr:uncharacterized protein LOC128884450 isoform X2 [Hylaeus volcanicus]
MTLKQKSLNGMANNVPDPRINGKECGLPFQTTQFFLCDPYHFLDSGEQLKLITNLNTLYITRVHQCNDHVSKPLLVTIFLASDHQNGQDTVEMQYPELFLETVLEKVSNAPNEDGSKELTHAPFLSSCGKHFAILYNPLKDKPITSIRCDNALEPIFTEPEYPELLQNFLSVCSPDTSTKKLVQTIRKNENFEIKQSELFKTLSLILRKIEENFPLTGN